MQVTSTLVNRCREIFRDGVDAAARKSARRCLIDSIAAAHAAVGERQIAILLESLGAAPVQSGCSVFGHAHKLRADDAALVNGTMISLQLYDDNNEQMRGHPSGPLWPAVLAVAERENRTLLEALDAFVTGYEVECRFGLLLNPSHYETGWHATSTQGTLAATVASCLLAEMSAADTAQALGIAASLAGGLRRNFGTMTMSFHSGVAASNGVRTARLAAGGFTADPDIFAGAMSFGDVFSREWSPAAFIESLRTWGEPLLINSPGPIFKLVPCGRPTVPGVECVMTIQGKHGVTHDRIRRIVCDVSYMYPRTLIHSRPVTGLQGKTSLEYCVAAALLDRRPTLASFTDDAVRRTEILALIDKMEVRVPPELSENVPEVRRAPFEQPVTVTIETLDGKTYRESVQYLRGSPQNPAADADLREKFVDCVAPHLGADRVETILQYIEQDKSTVRGLFELLKK